MKKKVFWIVILFIFILLAIAGYVIYKKWELVNARDNFISAIESYKSSNNYYMLVESKESNNTLKDELYSKDGKSIYYSYFYFPEFDEDGPTDKIYYYDGINTQVVIENEDEKKVAYLKEEEKISYKEFAMYSGFLSFVLKTNDTSLYRIDNVTTGNFEGKDCYIIEPNYYNEIIYIDKETYLPIGFSYYGDIYTCEFKTNVVKDSDFELPDVSDYTVVINEFEE